MYIHIGNDNLIRGKDLIGIFNIEKTSASADTRAYLASAAKRNCEVSCTDQLPRTFVVTFDKDTLSEKVYITRVSPSTIETRCM